MKILKSIVLLCMLSVAFVGCEDDDEVFMGTPVGSQNIVTLRGEISTPVEAALSGQEIDFTVTLPRTFNDTVSVEVTVLGDRGRRFRKSVDVMPGETTATEEITSPGGSLFETTFEMYISGIALQTVELGTHYLIESNVLIIPTSSSTVPTQDTNALTVRLVWPNASGSGSTMQLTIDRPDPLVDVVGGLFTAGGRQHKIRNADGVSNNNISSPTGDYIFGVKPSGIVGSQDIPYQFIVIYPNGDAVVYTGTYVGATATSPSINVAKINKSYNSANQAVFTVENIQP